jgi:hypothetical protein
MTSWVVIVAAALGAPAAGADLKGPIEVLRGVGPNGKGSAEAARAWRELAAADIARLPEVLAGMDGAGPLARNWLRSAVDQILERARVDKKPVPVAALEPFLRDRRHHPQARRLAYELVLEADRTAADRLLPGMMDDPSLELRRDAVARVLDQADKLFTAEKKTEALPLFRQAFAAAREKDQIDRAVKRLRELGEQVDPAAHLGLVLEWKLIGPFPNAKQQGVDTVYPPEQKIDPTATTRARPVRCAGPTTSPRTRPASST